jgi:hypothetical protein
MTSRRRGTSRTPSPTTLPARLPDACTMPMVGTVADKQQQSSCRRPSGAFSNFTCSSFPLRAATPLEHRSVNAGRVKRPTMATEPIPKRSGFFQLSLFPYSNPRPPTPIELRRVNLGRVLPRGPRWFRRFKVEWGVRGEPPARFGYFSARESNARRGERQAKGYTKSNVNGTK